MGLDFRERMFPCPNCRTMCKVHQYEDRYYSHPRIMMMSTVLKIRVPKLRCLVCDGYPQAAVPVARPNVSYTRLMEQEVFHLLADMCISSVARNTGLTCRIIFQMIRYRVEQALVLLDLSDVRVLYVDETSSKKGHNYITVVSDQNKRIVFLCEGKDSRTMDRLRDWLLEHNGDPERIEWVSCDLGEAYPSGVRRNFPNAVIIYDHFHVSKLFNDAFDKLLSEEMKEHENLKKERQRLLMNPSSFESEHERSRILAFADQFQRVGRGYRLKTLLGSIYDYADKDEASCCLDLWYEEVIKFGQKDMTRAAKSIMQRRDGILAWYDNPISNGYAEGINSMIQTTKRIAFGHANVENFIITFLKNVPYPRFAEDRAEVSVPSFLKRGFRGALSLLPLGLPLFLASLGTMGRYRSPIFSRISASTSAIRLTFHSASSDILVILILFRRRMLSPYVRLSRRPRPSR